jgi:hypothetical protein
VALISALQKNDFKPQKQTQKNIFYLLQRLPRQPRLMNTTFNQKNMKTYLKTATAIALSIISLNGLAQSRNVTVSNFNSIGVSSGIDLYLTQGSTESLVIKGDNDLIKDVVVEQKGSSINIKYKDGINWSRLFKNQSIKVYVSFKTLKSLAASGGSDVYSQNLLKAESFSLAASGGSDIKLNLNCKDLSVATSGGSDVELKGSGENLSVSTSGGSDLDAFGYTVVNARVSASGGSDANVNVSKALEANASGGSDVNYKGNAVVKKSASKSGDVNHVN